jgi:hypothetical protein
LVRRAQQHLSNLDHAARSFPFPQLPQPRVLRRKSLFGSVDWLQNSDVSSRLDCLTACSTTVEAWNHPS